MKKHLAILLWIICFFAKAQIKDIGLYYTAANTPALNYPYPNDMFFRHSKTVGVQMDLASANRLSFSVFGFINSSRGQYAFTYTPVIEYNRYAPHGRDRIVNFSYTGTQLGFGIAPYFQVVRKKPFNLYLGVKLSAYFFIRSRADYTSLFIDSMGYAGAYTHTISRNYAGLKNSSPDLFYGCLVLKPEFVLSEHLIAFIEPYLMIFNMGNAQFDSGNKCGANIGFCWQLKVPGAKSP